MAPSSFLSAFKDPKGRANKKHQQDPGQPVSVSIGMRSIQPADPTRVSLAALSDDLILYILDMVHDASPKTIPKCVSVCSSLYRHARYVQHRQLSIDFDRQESIQHLELASRERLLPAVRKLKVHGTVNPPSALDDMIQKMTGLRHVEWNAATITKPILQTLQSCPDTTLDVFIANHTKQLLSDLSGSTALVSVDIDITYATAEDCTQVTQPLRRVLLSCPNLRRLSLNLTRSVRGCVPIEPPAEYVGIGFAADERPAPLEELSIISYPWGFKARYPNSHGVNCVGYPGEGLEMDYWVNNFDWSRLTHLEDAEVTLAHKAVRELTALKHIRFTWSQGPEDRDFFDSVPSALESIYVPRFGSIGVNNLAQHAVSLRKLYLHQQQHHMDQWREGTISNDNLALICERFPQLQELGIDVKRDGNDWPYNMLDILATFPQLEKLELWFELGNAREIRPRPYLTMASASELFRYLVKRSSPLKNLHLHSGSSLPPEMSGWVTEESFWPSENSTSFVCQYAERDDDAARGLFDVICPKLSDRLNHRAQRMMRGQEKLKISTEYGINFRVALQGPIPLTEWMDLKQGKT
ncbi:hypothetical protein ACHAPJ_011658 [Fusarium lateritium]